MKNLFIALIAIFILSSLAFTDDLKLIREFQGGKLYIAGKINVVVMQGNFFQMGRQYGELLKDQIKEFYAEASKQVGLGTDKLPYNLVLTAVKKELAEQPVYVQEWVRGMAETSGLGYDKQLIFSNMLLLLIMNSGNCSGMIAWDKYTNDGEVVIGRNWDLPIKTLLPFQKFLTVAVFNPIGFGQSVADINYLGQITWQSGINKAGIFYDLQNGLLGDPLNAKNRLNSNSALMTMLFQTTSSNQVDAFFDATRAQEGALINVADTKEGACFEWGTNDYRKRIDDKKGLVGSSNHFTDNSWPAIISIPAGKQAAFTKERTENLLAMGKKYKGKITPDIMMKIFSTTIPNGGPTFDKDSGLITYYSIVAKPKDLTIWLNITDFQTWTEIKLKPLFLN